MNCCASAGTAPAIDSVAAAATRIFLSIVLLPKISKDACLFPPPRASPACARPRAAASAASLDFTGAMPEFVAHVGWIENGQSQPRGAGGGAQRGGAARRLPRKRAFCRRDRGGAGPLERCVGGDRAA